MRACNTRRSARRRRGDRKTPMAASAGFSARFVHFYVGFRIRVTGRPVFWRKGHVPEHRIGQRELHSHLRMIVLMPVNVRDNALQRNFPAFKYVTPSNSGSYNPTSLPPLSTRLTLLLLLQ